MVYEFHGYTGGRMISGIPGKGELRGRLDDLVDAGMHVFGCVALHYDTKGAANA